MRFNDLSMFEYDNHFFRRVISKTVLYVLYRILALHAAVEYMISCNIMTKHANKTANIKSRISNFMFMIVLLISQIEYNHILILKFLNSFLREIICRVVIFISNCFWIEDDFNRQ